MTVSELGGFLLQVRKLMIKYTVWHRAKLGGTHCERAALVGDQPVMDSGCVLQGSQETSSGGWALLEVCMSRLGGLEWEQGWWCGWRVGPARTDGAGRQAEGSQVAARSSLASGILEGDIKE